MSHRFRYAFCFPVACLLAGTWPAYAQIPAAHEYRAGRLAMGACCHLGTCTMKLQNQCQGTWLGAGTNCNGPDCNSNGWVDKCDIATGFSLNQNTNNIPDECEIACSAPCDVWTTVAVGEAGEATWHSFEYQFIPPDFFELGSEAFHGTVYLRGVPLDPNVYGDADTLIERSEDPVTPDKNPGYVGYCETTVRALRLRSTEPIEIVTNGVTTEWNVEVGLSAAVQPTGHIWARKDFANGGAYDSTIIVLARFVFRRVDEPFDFRVLDAGTEGFYPMYMGGLEQPWVHAPSPGHDVFDNLTLEWVPGVEDPTPFADAGGTITVEVEEEGEEEPFEHTVEKPDDCCDDDHEPEGACCMSDGTCADTTEADCTGDYLGDLTSCEPRIACCLPDGGCMETNPHCCEDAGGTAYPGRYCNEEYACCMGPSCVETTYFCCADNGGTYAEGESCSGPGACCLPQGGCISGSDAACCGDSGGVFQGPGTTCPASCTQCDVTLDPCPIDICVGNTHTFVAQGSWGGSASVIYNWTVTGPGAANVTPQSQSGSSNTFEVTALEKSSAQQDVTINVEIVVGGDACATDSCSTTIAGVDIDNCPAELTVGDAGSLHADAFWGHTASPIYVWSVTDGAGNITPTSQSGPDENFNFTAINDGSVTVQVEFYDGGVLCDTATCTFNIVADCSVDLLNCPQDLCVDDMYTFNADYTWGGGGTVSPVYQWTVTGTGASKVTPQSQFGGSSFTITALERSDVMDDVTVEVELFISGDSCGVDTCDFTIAGAWIDNCPTNPVQLGDPVNLHATAITGGGTSSSLYNWTVTDGQDNVDPDSQSGNSPNFDLVTQGTGSVTVKMEYVRGGDTCDMDECTFEIVDEVKGIVDLDIDSDNNNGYGPPDRSLAEDQVEDVAGDNQKPGKKAFLNDGFFDDDAAPDFADGYDIFGNQGANASASFFPMIVEVPRTVDIEKAKLRFGYVESDPAAVTRTGSGTVDDPYVYHLPSPPLSPSAGRLRVWTKDGAQSRLKAPVNAGGDFVKSGVEYDMSAFGSQHTISLYVECVGISAAVADSRITVELDPDGMGFSQSDAVRVTGISMAFVEKGSTTITLGSGFSHPYPEVEIGIGTELDPVTVGDLLINAGNVEATVTINGRVKSALADLVEDGSADITEVTIRINDLDEQTVNVTNSSTVAIEDIAPLSGDGELEHRFIGEFQATLTIPLVPGSNTVMVEATNAIGHVGVDSFEIEATLDTTFGLAGITNNEGSGQGVFNPVWVRVYDASIGRNEVGNARADLFGESQSMTLRNGELWLDRPFAQIGKSFEQGQDPINVLNAVDEPDTATAVYLGFSKTCEWSYSAGAYPAPPAPTPLAAVGAMDVKRPNDLKFAAGTRFTLEWYSKKLNEGWEVETANVYERDGRTWTFSGDLDQDTVVAAHAPIAPLNNKDGHRFEIIAFQDGMNDGAKSLVIKLRKGTRRDTIKWACEFWVVPLRTVIIAVDGYAFDSAMDNVTSDLSPTFKKIYEGSVNLTAAHAALPTITWANWPSIFTGSPPKEHGFLGNSYFPRETASGDLGLPLNSANSTGLTGIDTLQSIGIANGGTWFLFHAYSMMTRALPGAGSLYDKIAAVSANPSNKLNCVSVRMFYAGTDGVNTRLTRSFFMLGDPTGHSASDAAVLDDGNLLHTVGSGLRGKNAWLLHRPYLDVLTVYFPGPDNVAHAIGADTTVPVPPGWSPAETYGTHGDVVNPLPSIAAQVRHVTDGALKRIVDQIQKDGYLNACLFALVADHGLHAFQNTDAFNITSEDYDGATPGLEMQYVFNALGLTLWRDNDINQADAVYAPNGGMGQVYLKRSGGTWQQPPLNVDVRRTAAKLYEEATGVTPVTYREFVNSLGSPPALFVKVGGTDAMDAANNNFLRDFEWVKNTAAAPQWIETGTIDEFIAAHANAADWRTFKERLDEMNHKHAAGSRTGDIVFIMDGHAGFLSVNGESGLPGWHGGPTVSETLVPLMISLPGPELDGPQAFVENGLLLVSPQTDGNYRSWQLADILAEIIGHVRSPSDNP